MIEARLGEFEPAVKRLDGVKRHLLKYGPLRHEVAVMLDLAVIYCRHEYGENYRTARIMEDACLKRIPEGAPGEEGVLRERLEGLIEVLRRRPEDEGLDAIVDVRSSFVVPVPGIVAERLGSRGIVLVG